MTFPQDLTQWRVYSAEQSVAVGSTFDTIGDAQAFLWWVQSTAWWAATFPGAPGITATLGGGSNADGDIQSFAAPASAGDWTISLHPRMLNALVVLHEVAHCVAPQRYGDIKRLRRGAIDLREHHPHGPYFRAALAALAHRYKIGVDPDELRRAYAHFELETPDLEALQRAREHSAEVDAVWAEVWEEHERRWAADPELIARRQRLLPALPEVPPEAAAPIIPRELWGDWILTMRRHARRTMVSQARLAGLVDPVVHCTPRDVARLERLAEPPATEIDRARCLAFIAVLEVDPVWAETHHGLAAGQTTLTLEALEPIAPNWVELVRHLNGLLETRPPRWFADGDR